MSSLERHLPILIDIARYLVEHCDEELSLADLAGRASLSASRFQRLFKSAFSVTPKQLQKMARTERFRSLLKSGNNITEAIVAAGYGSNARIYSDTPESLGMTPRAYQRGGQGESLSWVCQDTILGKLAIAASDRGLCFAQFGEDCIELEAMLKAEFPYAELLPFDSDRDGQLSEWMTQLNAYLNRHQPMPDIPLDLRGTAFQINVWQFLKGLGDGERITYRQLAEGIGKPKAVRAAASACAANPIDNRPAPRHPAIPDGRESAHRCDWQRKQALLESESTALTG